MAEVVRNLEHRVAERTLDLGTRERWFRALVQNASDVVTVVDGDLIVRYQTPSALAHARPRAGGGRRGCRSTRCSSPADCALLREALVEAERRPGSAAGAGSARSPTPRATLVTTETTVTSLLHQPDVAASS